MTGNYDAQRQNRETVQTAKLCNDEGHPEGSRRETSNSETPHSLTGRVKNLVSIRRLKSLLVPSPELSVMRDGANMHQSEIDI